MDQAPGLSLPHRTGKTKDNTNSFSWLMMNQILPMEQFSSPHSQLTQVKPTAEDPSPSLTELLMVSTQSLSTGMSAWAPLT